LRKGTPERNLTAEAENRKCKVLEKIFAGLKKMTYLCSPFTPQM
jgi:hypothetical protein